MKRTFWTRNLFIGVLMGLVMALGVQESADAITKFTRGTGDLKMYAENQPFTISFSVGVQSPQLRTGYKLIPRGDEDIPGGTDLSATPYYLDDAGDGYTGESPVSRAVAHYYDEEAIDILAVGANVTKINSYDITPALNPPDLTDSGTNATKLSSSLTLTLVAGTAGTVTITISDTTPGTDRPTDVSAAPDLAFTVYIVENATEVAADELDLLGGITTNYRRGLDDFTDPEVGATVTDSSDVAITDAKIKYDVVSGSGQVYVTTTTGGRTGPKGRSITTSTAATVKLDMNGTTNKVTVTVVGSNTYVAPVTAFFIFGLPQLEATRGSSGQKGATSGRLENPLGIRVKDGLGRTISGLGVTFTTSATGAAFIPIPSIPDTMYTFDSTDATTRQTIIVKTNRSGIAETYYQLGSAAGDETITAAAAGVTRSDLLKATAESITSVPNIEIVSGNNQRTDKSGDLENPLVVKVTRRGQRISDVDVTFTANRGILTNTTPPFPAGRSAADSADTGVTVQDRTDGQGLASVTYLLLDHSGAVEVVASISGTSPTTYRRSVTFNINGRASAPIIPVVTGDDDDDDDDEEESITVTPSSLSGETGARVSLTVSPSTIPVTITGTAFRSAGGLFVATETGATRNLLLPNTAGSYSLILRASGYTSVTVPVTVTAGTATSGDTTETATSGTLSVSGPISGAPGTAISVTVRARDTANAAVGSLSIRLTADASIGTLAQTSVVTNASGLASTVLTLSSTPGATGFVRASASGYIDNGGRRFSVSTTTDATTEETQDDEEEEEETVREPASIEISGPATRSGTANTALEAVLLVRVLDADDAAVEDVRVTFRVREGRGELSQKGNRRGIIIYTDSNGHARAAYTPISASSTVEASVPGVQETVTFTIRATGAPASTDTSDTKQDTPRTTRDTTSDTVSPTVLVAAAKRPPMLWVADGKMYTLVSTDVQEFVPSASNVMNIAIGGGKVYWTEKTSASSGTINSANLDGSDAKELKSLLAIPIGIGVDVPNSKLYWTNSRGRIQSANLDGSGIQNVMENIRNPNDLALAGGNVYWTESNHGSVRFVNLRGQKQVRVISTGDDPAGSLVIGGGKVYWTEKVGESGGTINAANLNGSEATELASIFATPIGIAVDTARSKLFWTNDRGRVQTASLSGSSIRNVVNGLENPGEILLSNSLKETPKATPTQSTTTAAGRNKYDINGDGKVDSTDTGLVVLAISTGDTSAKLDVNGDGKVNFSDYVLVSENVDAGAAGAPSVFGMKMSAAQIERLQEQIELLIASGDRSPAAMRALIYFQQLIATARPEKTQLLANYPNPFNPETWMPYELATDTNVTITIYNTQGVVIRTLELGQQSAGYYTGRDRAAYWDGRNAFGEQVASGIYFYQLETDTMSALRKMVILK